MSLCLALLLVVIAIDWWQGWEPFKHPFQMPRNCAANTPFNPLQPAPAIEPPIGRRCARAAEHPLGGSHQQPGIRLQGRVREGVSTFDLAGDGRNAKAWSLLPMAGSPVRD